MRTLCLDFDGVIHSYISGWQKPDVLPDAPVPGAIEFLALAVKSFRVTIYSARTHAPGGLDAMQQYVHEHLHVCDALAEGEAQEVFDLIEWPEEKPAAWLTIDDRALTFNGTFPSVESLHAFKVWNHKDYKKRTP